MSFGLFDIRMPYTTSAQIAAADTTVPKNLVAWTATPILITDILLTNSDTADHIVALTYYTGTVSRRLSSVNVPARAGYDGAAPVSFFANGAPPNFGAWALVNAYSLQISVTETMPAVVVVDAMAFGGYL
jgi:hypothetical protein